MDAVIFIVRALLEFLLVTAFLLRFLLSSARADMRNQLSQAVIRLSNPLVLPLRKIVPKMGRIDTAAFVAVLLVQAAATGVLWLLGAFPGIETLPAFLLLVVLSLFTAIVWFYIYALVIYVLLSWIAPGTYSPGADLLSSLCEPLLRPVRRLVPPFGGIDLSSFLVIIGLRALLFLVDVPRLLSMVS